MIRLGLAAALVLLLCGFIFLGGGRPTAGCLPITINGSLPITIHGTLPVNIPCG